MSAFRRTATATVLCAGMALTAGCQRDADGETKPLPPAESSTTAPTETSSPSPTNTTKPAWHDRYSKKELAAYEAALDRFETYEQRSEPIWRRGKATPAAEELFKEYFTDGAWQREISRLRSYEQANVEVHGTPTVLRSQATRIAVSERGGSTTIRQCIDYRTSQLLQDGEQAPGAPKSPRIRQIVLDRSSDGGSWLISGVYAYEGKRKC